MCIVAGSLVGEIAPAFGVPPKRSTARSTGAHRFPAAFEQFMVIEYGELWMHTVQEQVIRRMFIAWQDKQKR